MKNKSIIVTGVSLITVMLLWSSVTYKAPKPIIRKAVASPVTMCGTFVVDWEDTTAVGTGILPGLGNLHFAVTTSAPRAQEYFDQGLRLVYAFNHWEAIQSFRQALKLDPDFPMAYWGLALAYGPNLNDINPGERERLAFESIQKAVSKKRNVSAFEKDFIDAMATRYNGKAYDVRDSLNKAYAKAMITLAKKYPHEAEAQALCADAIMNTMPWDYWEKDGNPKPETREAKMVLENVLKKFPDHPGAHHLYIHLVEASPAPHEALASARFLEKAMPGAGHIVHMPAHIYIRMGDYGKSIQVNERAVFVDEEYLSRSDNRGLYRLMYYPHNVDFISFSAYMQGRSDLAVRTAMKLAYKGSLVVTANPAFGQYLMAEPLIAFTRFGKWNDILSLPEPDAGLLYPQALWRFARGMALVRSNNIALAKAELSALDSLSELDTLKSMYFSFNPVSDIVQIPLHILKGEIMLKDKKTSEGIDLLSEAVKLEDSLRYMEPPDWKLFSRHYLGAAFLEAGNFAEAERVFQEDLKRNRENGWALKGLEICQQKMGDKKGSSLTAKRFAEAWKDADIELAAARF